MLLWLLMASTFAHAVAGGASPRSQLEERALHAIFDLDPEFHMTDRDVSKLRRSVRHDAKLGKITPARARAMLDLCDQVKALRRGFDAERTARALVAMATASDSHPEAGAAVGLSPIEAAAIFEYTGSLYSKLNALLRDPAGPGPDASALAEYLNQALDKLPIFVGPVKRGMKEYPGWREHYSRPRVTEPAFTSTSANLSLGAFSYAIRLDIQSRTGRDISMLTTTPLEREVLFKAGTTFDVEPIEEHHGVLGQSERFTIRMVEAP